MKTVKIGLLGLGTVGGGVYKLIERQKSEMVSKTGADVEIAKILVHNRNKKREGIDESLLTDQWKDIIEDKEIDIVVEVMGGIEPAKTIITEALKAGKNVVTANKDLLAVCGEDLLEIAAAHHVDLMFEAAVAGGIPIMRPLRQCLAGNEITEVTGIVNGTTNYILTKMFELGMSLVMRKRIRQRILKVWMPDVKWQLWLLPHFTARLYLMMCISRVLLKLQHRISSMQKNLTV